MLTEEHKKQRMTSASAFLQRYNEGEKFLDHIANGDDTWISYSNIKTGGGGGIHDVEA
jgi:hypothetical protein